MTDTTSDQITDEVVRAIAAIGIAADDITSAARLRSDLELDSTELVEITLELKRTLGVDIDLELDADPSVADVCALVGKAAGALS
ncbi:phosphopantetheine-binding protein [Kutzneria kofuensis]|uniref:Acyl carrier protein n=1 Tax=Kutzneria kofuensis TaxID=103725 RepID=A0A7W9KQJ5_9PSEU|nr:phosphopantetheine-binding protein [Kutzneria kofuensis]MBB5896802.1 acyl carrier protein [Kutzneria kofuensis]